MTACTLKDWQEIVNAAVTAAKCGGSTARAWLGRYLVGDPATKAPAPTTVIIQNLTGEDIVMERAVSQLANELNFGGLFEGESTSKARLTLTGK